ncbi:MAG: hypothetical protein ABI178_11675 [Rhodanobacter sp.]
MAAAALNPHDKRTAQRRSATPYSTKKRPFHLTTPLAEDLLRRAQQYPAQRTAGSLQTSLHRRRHDTVMPFYPLRDARMKKIVRLKLNQNVRRILADHDACFVYDKSWSTPSPPAAPKSTPAPATSTTSSATACSPKSPAKCWNG